VRANPMYRNRETAQYAFAAQANGNLIVDSTLAGGAAGLLRLLAQPVPPGTNRALVTRIGILTSALRGHGARVIDEGDCFVVRPAGDSTFRVLARLRAEDWLMLRRS
jgi:hypothetical protein